MQLYSMHILSVKAHEQIPVEIIQRVAPFSHKVSKDFFCQLS